MTSANELRYLCTGVAKRARWRERRLWVLKATTLLMAGWALSAWVFSR